MGSKKTTWWIICSVAISLIIGIVIGNFISGKSFGRKLFMTPNNKVSVILDIINQDYVDAVNMKDLTENAINNIIKELDPHSSYISGKELQSINEDMEGHFGGLGVTPYLFEDTLIVLNIVHGGPASQVGLMPGDRIVFADDSLLVGKDITDEFILNTFRGPIGTSVKLGIKRNSPEYADQILEYTITRGDIPIRTIQAAYEAYEGIGIIKIYDKFSHTTYDEFIQAITKLSAKGCHSFIIDLRMNGGGSLDAAINIANEFLPAGRMIVYAEGKSFPRMESISDGSGNFPENTVVILMDQMSASASEVVAGALQDNDRAIIMGRRSFGKGLVQNQIELSDNSALRLTIARYFTPSGRNIQRKYTLGKSDEYNQDWINQLSNGEGFHQDSLKIDTTLMYETFHGRTVYGGGGIIPDIFIPIDTTHLTSYFLKMENHGIFEKFAFQYFDKNLHLRDEYKDYMSMLEYLKTQPIFSELIRFADMNGIRRCSTQISRSENQIMTTAYARILQNFFGDEAFYTIQLQNDPMVEKAVQTILSQQ
ncbi:MAG: S41 family peptidase [Bacteroidales bacterium]|nr:S41 family peptidase [Bacteroidales bacterium]